MAAARLLTAFCALAAVVGASPRPSLVQNEPPSLTRRDGAADPLQTICGDILDRVDNHGEFVFYASDAYSCLKSVPFHPAVARRFVEYYNTSAQFQSTLAYLKNPPEGYQQPAVDVENELARILENVNKNAYQDQYSFEADVQSVIYRMHDAHSDLYAGILAAFTFGSPYGLVSASKDGKEAPKIYLKDHLEEALGNSSFQISPVVAINDEDTITFLERFATLNSVGMLESHAEWNELMNSPPQDIQSGANLFTSDLTFYPGDELNFTLENGEIISTWWLAYYTESFYTGPLQTGGDFFNYFVLGLLPESFNASSVPPTWQFNDNATEEDEIVVPDAINPNDISKAYPPNPDVVQAELDTQGGVIGYFLNDSSTGVLSIATFNQGSFGIEYFFIAIQEFIDRAQEAKLSKIVIDLQGNSGGLVLLALTTFKQFFPRNTPFAGSRRRSHPLADSLGEVFTSHWGHLADDDEQKDALQASEWVITNHINPNTGNNFSSWDEYHGPRRYNEDDFSLLEQYDLGNTRFDLANFGGWIPTAYTDNAANPPPPTPWKPEDIVVLTDGKCSSSCALFVEMLSEVGVRTVVAGGKPIDEPMQAVSGSRGAAPYQFSSLDEDLAQASEWLGSEAPARLPQVRDSGLFINYGSVNLRDQMRKNDESGLPLQFAYLPADCRIYYSLSNVWNVTALWRDVANAVWVDPSFCIAASDRVKPGSTITTPEPPSGDVVLRPEMALFEDPEFAGDDSEQLVDSPRGARAVYVPQLCQTTADCTSRVCMPVNFRCGNQQSWFSTKICKHGCNNLGGTCGYYSECRKMNVSPNRKVNSFAESRPALFAFAPAKGQCLPVQGTPEMCRVAKPVPGPERAPTNPGAAPVGPIAVPAGSIAAPAGPIAAPVGPGFVSTLQNGL